MVWEWSKLLNTELILRDKNLAYFMLGLIVLHATCFAIESTRKLKYTLLGGGALIPETVEEQEPNNWIVQLTKLRENNLEKLMYLGTSIGVFVVGANLGFQAAGFSQMYNELNLIFMVYIASIAISYWANWICANQEGNPLNANGDPPIDKHAKYFNLAGAAVTPVAATFSKNQGIVSPYKTPLVFWIAQWLLIVTNLVQSVLLSYFSFGLVGAYTSAYPFGLLARALTSR
jgi:hypothetical protein